MKIKDANRMTTVTYRIKFQVAALKYKRRHACITAGTSENEGKI